MSVFEAIILGLIQGLTEFLPVSSSGHLVLFQDILNLVKPGITLEVILHFGTLLSVFWVFRKDFIDLLSFRKDKDQRYYLFVLIIGVIPTAAIGIFLRSYVDLLFQSTLVVGIAFMITGGILKFLTMLPEGNKNHTQIMVRDALWIGLFQGLAVIPGISRSGSTIAAALWRGLDRKTAVRYSFMLSAPVILGATILEVSSILATGLDRAMLLNYFAGGLVAFLAGIAAIQIFIKVLSEQKFQYFAYYCWVLGTIVIGVSLI
ncbi:MAG TPA: undecaprenyl-diphosphate phosphatase [Candidatus Limnocylindrales bacterium]|nr:undecaprenyl-diphosphate phosphatase [Candidatus Limnocylindrales bacterium]